MNIENILDEYIQGNTRFDKYMPTKAVDDSFYLFFAKLISAFGWIYKDRRLAYDVEFYFALIVGYMRRLRKNGDYVWLNTYECDQCYGGSEEGGWWYYSNRPMRSQLMLRINAENIRATNQLDDDYCYEISDYPARYNYSYHKGSIGFNIEMPHYE